MKGSYISKRFPIIYKLFGKRFKHRGFTHSLLFIGVIAFLFQCDCFFYPQGFDCFHILIKIFKRLCACDEFQNHLIAVSKDFIFYLTQSLLFLII
ncbi:metal-dependent hydrolase [Eisenbergiella porci]|uniref:metal-dependent hydrolase n=1 Tax=Eisenbergiella porci TaxID=2652274 RepID=UPI003FA48ADC